MFFCSASVVWLGVLSVVGVLVFALGRGVGGGKLASILVIVGEGMVKGWSLLLVFVMLCVRVLM